MDQVDRSGVTADPFDFAQDDCLYAVLVPERGRVEQLMEPLGLLDEVTESLGSTTEDAFICRSARSVEEDRLRIHRWSDVKKRYVLLAAAHETEGKD